MKVSRNGCCVRDYLPLQQGLRQKQQHAFEDACCCQRLSSITTRIKTWHCRHVPHVPHVVRDYLPLQQGLRLPPLSEMVFSNSVRDYLPLQQGLRLGLPLVSTSGNSGQRLSSITTRIKTHGPNDGADKTLKVRDYLPLQQGLRLVTHVPVLLL